MGRSPRKHVSEVRNENRYALNTLQYRTIQDLERLLGTAIFKLIEDDIEKVLALRLDSAYFIGHTAGATQKPGV